VRAEENSNVMKKGLINEKNEKKLLTKNRQLRIPFF
jgi:hypothetical protein